MFDHGRSLPYTQSLAVRSANIRALNSLLQPESARFRGSYPQQAQPGQRPDSQEDHNGGSTNRSESVQPRKSSILRFVYITNAF
ncbi:MAG: hypothetical protein Q7T57_08180, partial [Dehalococcoidales bacterium]|nr:hypothetical protein [Dehalococcoidales bacterium]